MSIFMYTIGFYAFRVSFLLLFIVIALVLSPVSVRETYIYHAYNIDMDISFDYFKSFNTCTYIYITSYFIIMHCII